jgi:hypothetical protein
MMYWFLMVRAMLQEIRMDAYDRGHTSCDLWKLF